MIIAGSNEANAFATAGGTPSGILMINFSFPLKRTKISVEIIPTIIAINKPFELIPNAPPKAKKEPKEITPAETPSFR